MNTNSPAVFHQLYGARKPKVTYYGSDFLDYTLMVAISAVVVVLAYGPRHVMAWIGVALCVFELVTFTIRHGVEFSVPAIVRKPLDVFYMLVYKIRNLRPMYLITIGLLLLENVLIAKTPGLPHHVELMRRIAVYLFYFHFISITGYRTAILIDHLAKRELVREVLMQTPWRRVIREKTNITLEILHAYGTGVLTHILLIVPWYLVIKYSRFSAIFLPAICALNVLVHLKWVKAFNAWFYRDHWLAHNSECEFLFLHGTHHDAIPSGLIAVAENGFLEGVMRFTLGSPVAFYSPIVSFLVYMSDVKTDITLHQYIPGIYPRLSRRVLETFQHSKHHYGQLEPYGMAIKVDQPGSSSDYSNMFPGLPEELRNSALLDEELTGFEWDNPTYRQILALWDKYQS